MKKIICFLVLATVLFSCSKDDDIEKQGCTVDVLVTSTVKNFDIIYKTEIRKGETKEKEDLTLSNFPFSKKYNFSNVLIGSHMTFWIEVNKTMYDKLEEGEYIIVRISKDGKVVHDFKTTNVFECTLNLH